MATVDYKLHWGIKNEQLLSGGEVVAAGCHTVPGRADSDVTQSASLIHRTLGGRKDLYLLCYVWAGKGWVGANGLRMKLSPGKCFAFFPGEQREFGCDPASGWRLNWIAMRGSVLDGYREQGLLSGVEPRCWNGRVAGALSQQFDVLNQWCVEDLSVSRWGVNSLGVHMFSLLVSEPREEADSQLAGHMHKVAKAKALIEERLDDNLDVNELARELCVSTVVLRRAFKSHTGKSPKHYHVETRLKKAQQLLRRTDMSISEIAYSLNFYSPAHLSRQFKKLAGVSPSNYRLRFGVSVDAKAEAGSLN